MPFEFEIKKMTHRFPVPSPRMPESRIEREVSAVKRFRLECSLLPSADRHIEDRKVQKRDRLGMINGELKRPPRFMNRFNRSAEEEVDIRRNPRSFQVFERSRR